MSAAVADQVAASDEVASEALHMAVTWIAEHAAFSFVSFIGFSPEKGRPWVSIRHIDAMRRLLPGVLATVVRDTSWEKYRVTVDGIDFECSKFSPMTPFNETRTETL